MEENLTLTPLLPHQKSNLWVWIGVCVVMLGVGIGIGLFLGKQIYSQNTVQIDSYDQCVVAKGSYVQESNPATCVTSNGLRFKGPIASPTSTPDPTANWKTYINQVLGFQLNYPPTLKVTQDPKPSLSKDLGVSWILMLDDRQEGDVMGVSIKNSVLIQYTQNPVNGESHKPITNIKETTQGLESATFFSLQGYPAAKIRLSTSSIKNETPIKGVVVSIFILKDKSLWSITGDTINSDVSNGEIDQILSTFRFVDTLPEKTNDSFCGGIAGIICPEGYKCKYDGSYPDASGVCVKN